GEAQASILRRAADGTPELAGTHDARLAVMIPDCVNSQPLPRPLVVFGHGLFGTGEDYLAKSFVIDIAEQLCAVVVAGDFIGLTATAITDLNHAPEISEKLAQSVIDFIALDALARGPLAQAPELHVGGQPVIDGDPAHAFYIGASLGGIMGSTFMAYDPTITKG